MSTLSEDVTLAATDTGVMIDGRFTDGSWFHFRALHGLDASLGVSDVDAQEAVIESMCAEGWGVVLHRSIRDRGAAYPSPTEAFDLLRSMAAEFVDDPRTTLTTERNTAP